MECNYTMFSITPYDNTITEKEKKAYNKNEDDISPWMEDMDDFISNLSEYKTYDGVLKGFEEAWERCKSKFQAAVPSS